MTNSEITRRKSFPSLPTVIVPSKDNSPVAITRAEYDAVQAAFEYLDKKLFDGTLPNVAIVYSRHAHSGGHFAPDRFTYRGGNGGREHELSLNPDGFVNQTDEYIVSILLHEMVHLWQHLFGKAKRKNYAYHDKEWAAKMEALGLMPSNSGMVGGKRTGQRMSHYVVPGGAYQQAFAALAATGWKLNLQSTIRPVADKKKSNKTTYDCPACAEVSAWGKPDLGLVCKACLLDSIRHMFGADNATATALIETIDGVTMLARPNDAASSDQSLHEAAE